MSNFDSFRADYQLVAASAAALKLVGQSGKGAVGDIIDKLIIIPLTVAAGDVSLGDGDNAAMTVFKSGALADLKPHVLILGARSVSGAWKLTTGTNVQVLAIGRFQ